MFGAVESTVCMKGSSQLVVSIPMHKDVHRLTVEARYSPEIRRDWATINTKILFSSSESVERSYEG